MVDLKDDDEIVEAGELQETPPPKIVKMAEELACKLNAVEWASRAQELSDALQAVEQVEERKKAMSAQIGADMKTAKAKANKLANMVSTHTEYREVTVEVKYDYDTGKVTRTRTDNNEVISEREMTDSERQLELVEDADTYIEQNRKAERKADELAEIEDIDDEDLA